MTVQCSECSRAVMVVRRGKCGACYERMRIRQTAYGRWNPDRADAAPVRAHVQALRDAGVALRRIPDLSGVSLSTLRSVVYGKDGRAPAAWISRANAERILAVEIPADPLSVAAGGTPVPAIGTHRRLQALVAAGYTNTYLATEMGMTLPNFGSMMRRQEQVSAATHRRAAALFDRLSLQPGPSARSRNYGARNKWPLPLQWDEESIDDPKAGPVYGSRRQSYKAVAS